MISYDMGLSESRYVIYDMVLDHIIDGSGHDGGVISTSFASAPRQGTGKSRENRLETSGNVGNHGFSPMKYSVYGFREIYGDIWKMMETYWKP